jgi:MFS family permease
VTTIFAGAEPLRSPTFRRYLAISTTIALCLWTYQTSLTWTLLETTDSSAAVSLLQTLMTIPLPLALLPAGLLTDRFGARPMLAVAISGYVLAVGGTGLLALTGNLTVPLALAFAFLLGIFDALNVVAGPVFVGRSVPPAQMGAAIGLSTLGNGIGRIVGGPLGGATVAAFGPAGALLPAAGGLLFALLLATTLPKPDPTESAVRWRPGELLAAFGWARRTPAAIAIVALGASVALFMSGFVVLLPAVARDLLGAGSTQLGLLAASSGLGVLLAAFAIDPVGRRIGRRRIIAVALLVASGLLVTLGQVSVLPVAALVVGMLSASAATFSATVNLTLQSLASVSIRGRVLALYGLVFYALQPIGFVGVGLAADRFGVSMTLAAMGAATAASTLTIVGLGRLLGRARPVDAAAEPG